MTWARSTVARLVPLLEVGFGHVSLSFVLWRAGERAVTVLDIDNTLSDSWPTLVTPVSSERDRLATLVPLPGMKVASHDVAVSRGDVIIYLSHRQTWFRPVTLRWLRRAGFDASSLRVILVPSAAAKLAFLRRIADGSRPVDYWDDLSHGTEHGVTLLYSDVIDAVRALPLTYHDVEEIAVVTTACGHCRDDN